jgi:hypothetical protein
MDVESIGQAEQSGARLHWIQVKPLNDPHRQPFNLGERAHLGGKIAKEPLSLFQPLNFSVGQTQVLTLA